MKNDLELALLVTAGAVCSGLAAVAVCRCLRRRQVPPSPAPSPATSPASSIASSPAHSEEGIVEVVVVPPPPPPPAFFQVVLPPAVVEPPAAVPGAAAGLATIFTNVVAFFADLSSEIVRRG